MAASLEQITADVLALSPEEREQLMDRIWESIDPGKNEPLSAEWEAVIERRIQEIDDGVETIPADEFFAKMRRRFGA